MKAWLRPWVRPPVSLLMSRTGRRVKALADGQCFERESRLDGDGESPGLGSGAEAVAASHGAGEHFIDEARHRLAPVPGFVVEDAHEFAVDAGRIVGSPGHGNEGPE